MLDNSIKSKFNYNDLSSYLDLNQGFEDSARGHLVLECLRSSNKTLYNVSFNLYGDARVIYPRVVKELDSEFRVVKSQIYQKEIQDKHSREFLTNLRNDSLVEINRDEKVVCMVIHSIDKGLCNRLRDLTLEYPRPPDIDVPDTNDVNTLIQSGNQLQMYNIGEISEKFIPENYLSEAVRGYDALIKDFSKKLPGGRLAIIDGPPGTGKSHMVNSLICKLNNHQVLLASRSIISEEFAPQLTAVLLENQNKGTPILLVIEDGDQALVPRGVDNMDAIASLLNLTDGILGTLLDMRIVITTNAEKVQIDPAFFRPGRLSQRISVPILPSKEATEVFHRLAPNLSQTVLNRPHTLADVYQLVRDLEGV